MPKRDPRVALLQMRDHAREAVEFVRSRTREDLDRDRMLQLALLHLVQTIGEAAGRIAAPVIELASQITATAESAISRSG